MDWYAVQKALNGLTVWLAGDQRSRSKRPMNQIDSSTRTVPVRAYERLRKGKLENVCKHRRSLPKKAANDDRYDGGC